MSDSVSSDVPDHESTRVPCGVEQRLEEVAEHFLDELHAGKSPDRAQWVAAHPELSPWLGERLKMVADIHAAAHDAGAPQRFPGGAGAASSPKQAGRRDESEPVSTSSGRQQKVPLYPAGERCRGDASGDAATSASEPHERAIRLKCPHCGNRIQFVEPKSHEVTCENCGSSFQVDPGTTTAYSPDRLPERIGKFEVLELLGRGAFGAVYKARDPELDRTVAIKLPRAGYFGTREEEERFLREARAAARLKHPNIVQVHDIAHEHGVPYIVSEYIEGITLADLLTRTRPTFRESAELMARIADALDYAHREKIVHRDIKPSNILLSGVRGQELRTLNPFLTDFGLARRDEGEITVTLDGQILGTPAYMAPEQAAGEQHKVDARSDVYSLGVVLYELLTGELPFRGNKRMLLYQVLQDEPRAPRRLNDRIPRDLETICLKAMAKSSSRRYASARALAEDLERWLNGEPIQARSVRSAERLWRWSRRNPILAALSATVASLLILLAIGASVAAIKERGLATTASLARDKAEHALAGERDARTQASQAQNNEAAERRRAEQRLVRQYVANGVRLMDPGELFDSLVWFTEALRLDQGGPQREALHRMRIASVLKKCPKLSHNWFLESNVSHAEFSPDGTRIVAASGDGTVHIWDARTGKLEIGPLKAPEFLTRASFSPDGQRLLTVSSHCARVWDLATQQPITPELKMTPPLFTQCGVFSRDGLQVATGGGCNSWGYAGAGVARVWDASTGEPITPVLRAGKG